ncbi:phosphatase PAP2 family protein [Niveibacterium sp.]|uniref:acid phosphatase n=1 Tax=Niveibacterium sp. TaxID=2017444 RepID=UPI0035B0084C
MRTFEYQHFRFSTLFAATVAAAALSACGGNDNNADTTPSTAVVVPSAPVGLGAEESAPVPAGVTAYVDDGASNVRGDACHATVDTNAGVRVVAGFLDIWTPRSLLVDAGQTAPASGSCAAVVASDWNGIPGSATDGVVKNASIHAANIAYVERATAGRTAEQELAAYLDDRRGKGYSITDGMGPLTATWRSGAQQTTTITAIPADAGTVVYNDGGNNLGVGGTGNANLGLAVDFIAAMSGSGSTEPAKRFFKYARPWRWSSKVVVAPSLLAARSSTPTTDGGFISGHAAEGWRDALAMAYLVPERYQEMLTRAMELGENRILAGMHSPLDVIGGRVQATAVVAYNLNHSANAALKTSAFTQAQTWLQSQTGTASAAELNAYAHAAPAGSDRFADLAANRVNFANRMTYGFSPIASATAPAVVPKGAELLLETRQPYLSAAQRRVVLKTTAIASGYPVLDDAEGWGRLNLFAAADGYGAFNGDVIVTMDAAQGGFSAADSWKNDIGGAGLLTKKGSGVLTLTGANTWTGGSLVAEGVLAGASTTAFGKGDVYVSGGTARIAAPATLVVAGRYTQAAGGNLELALGNGSRGRLAVGGTLTLVGGGLHVTLADGYKPAVGDTLNLITAGSVSGKFATVSVDGYKVTPIYTSNAIQLRIDG